MMFYIPLVILLLIILALLQYMRLLRRKRDILLQEKDATYNFIHDVSDAFVQTEQPHIDFLLERVLFYGKQTTKATAGAIYFLEPDNITLHVRAVSGLFPPIVHGIDEHFKSAESKFNYVEMLVKKQSARFGEGLVGTVAEQGTAILIEDAERDERVRQCPDDFLAIQSILLVPMRFQNTVMGVLVVINRLDDAPFVQTDLNLLQALADQASVTIYFAKFSEELHKKRLLDYDLQIARRIQTALLPKEAPDIKNMELAAFSLPARAVGGDYYDYVRVDDNHLGIMVADVAGKGVSGAIFISIYRSVFHANAQGCLNPAQVLKAVNSVISSDIHDDMFITALYLIVNLKTFEVRVARAGHPNPLIISPQKGKSHLLELKGMAVGMGDTNMFNTQLEEISFKLKEKQILVAYTDGIYEALNPLQQEWGIARLQETILANSDEKAEDIVGLIQRKLVEFIGDMPQYDDMTLVLLRRN